MWRRFCPHRLFPPVWGSGTPGVEDGICRREQGGPREATLEGHQTRDLRGETGRASAELHAGPYDGSPFPTSRLAPVNYLLLVLTEPPPPAVPKASCWAPRAPWGVHSSGSLTILLGIPR